MRIIAVVNQKGGVGKTTTTVNLAHALALAGNKITLIDLDPQGHLGVSLGLREVEYGLDQVMLDDVAIAQRVQPIKDGLQIVPAGPRLDEIEHCSANGTNGGNLLRHALSGQFQDQDFILMDCPPASGLLVVNALQCATEVLIPMTGDYLSLQGLSHLMGTLGHFEQSLQRKFELWVVMSRFQERRRLSKEVLATLLKHFPTNILATTVREAVVLAECASFGQSVLDYRPRSRSADEFRQLAEDFLHQRVMQ